MINENESAFPVVYNSAFPETMGITKLEYFTLEIYCAFKLSRSSSIEQAKLLLKELEESK